MKKPQSSLEDIALGIFEKALSKELSWSERLSIARQANYDFVEMAIDETDKRIQRLDWTPDERAKLLAACQDIGVPIKSLSLSVHRRFPLGSEDKPTRKISLDLFRKSIDLSAALGPRRATARWCGHRPARDQRGRVSLLSRLLGNSGGNHLAGYRVDPGARDLGGAVPDRHGAAATGLGCPGSRWFWANALGAFPVRPGR